jgi:hypothetical protein
LTHANVVVRFQRLSIVSSHSAHACVPQSVYSRSSAMISMPAVGLVSFVASRLADALYRGVEANVRGCSGW